MLVIFFGTFRECCASDQYRRNGASLDKQQAQRREAKYIGREATTLPGQAENVGNFSLSYEKYGITTRLSMNVHGKYIYEVGEDKDEDVYYNNHTQVDFSAGYKLTDKIVVYADVLNLTNEPLLYYSGIRNRPIQRELYSFNARLGLKYDF